MMKLLITIGAASLLLAFGACSKKEGDAKPPAPRSADQPATKADVGHAAPGVEPGTHGDWCGEHAVPESQCTRCNPDLVAAFKATGDWCEEHGLPESQCLACNPELTIVRPPPAPSAEPEE